LPEVDPAGAGKTLPGAGAFEAGAMRILFVSPVLPPPPAHGTARFVAAQLIEHLGTRHVFGMVAAAGSADASARSWLSSRSAFVEVATTEDFRRRLFGGPPDGLRGLGLALRRACVAFRPDVVHLESAGLAPLARVVGVPCVLRMENGGTYDALDAVSTCVVECADDARPAAGSRPLNCVDVIPPGIDVERFAYRRAGNPSRFVFTGDLSAPEDLEAARRLATSIVPRVRRRIPRAELLIASVGSAERARELGRLDGVRVESRLGDLRPSVWGAALYVSPAGAGAGRAARLLEAFALGTPVIASAASLARVDDAVSGRDVLAADSAADVAAAVCLLMREAVVADTLARNARALVERVYGWAAIAGRYDAVYRRLGQRPMERAA
jgi:glycosyltransferase involved in cell wall biosynthesis